MKRVVWRSKPAVLVAAAVAAGAGITSFGVFGANGAAPRTGPLVVHEGLERPSGAFVRGDELYDHRGNRSRLAAPVSGALMGPLSPVAASSPDGRAVVYNSWRELRPVDAERSFSKQGIGDGEPLATPSLRVYDETGRDFLFERGAYSAAWRGDGAIAFVDGVDPDFRAGRVYAGRVLVREGAHGRDVAWTTEPARYVVYGWAGERLLFYRIALGEKLELLVADAPGRIRPLADGSAVATSPDGTRVAVVSQDGTNVRVLAVASGRELSWLDVTTANPSLRWVGYSGSWVGDHVVAPASAGLAVFHVGSESLELEQVLGLDRDEFPLGVQEPRFTDDAANQIAATADVPPANGRPGLSFFLDCDRIERSCQRGEAAPATEWLRPVDEGARENEGGR